MLEECPQLGAEHEGVRAGVVVEGLLAHAVPRQEEQPLPDVPDREGEHAVERRRTIFSVFLVCMHDNFRVGLRTKPATPALELIAEGLVVVDIPVVDDPYVPVPVADRLGAGTETATARTAALKR